jgi:hypothetical protein
MQKQISFGFGSPHITRDTIYLSYQVLDVSFCSGLCGKELYGKDEPDMLHNKESVTFCRKDSIFAC